MDLDKAGGAAFPLQFDVIGPACDPITGKQVQAGHTNAHVFVGMSVRDYFAAQALTTIPAYASEDVSTWAPADFARHAYLIADAMLAERAK